MKKPSKHSFKKLSKNRNSFNMGMQKPLHSQGFTLDSSSKYQGMFHNLNHNPLDALKFIEENCLGLKKIKELEPHYKYYNTFEILSSLPNDKLDLYPDLKDAKKIVMSIAQTLDKNFKLYIEERLHQGHNLPNAHLLGIQKFMGDSGFFNELNIKDVYKDDAVSDLEAERVLYTLRMASRLIPNFYKKSIPDVVVVIRPENSTSAFASIEKEVVISLNLKNNISHQMAEALHEYCHLVEKFNPEVLKSSNEFLLSRVFNLKQISLKDLNLKSKRPYLLEASETLVYEGKFIDSYIGKTYGALDKELKQLVPTEVLSVGMQSLFIHPIAFYLKDPGHFELIKKLMKSKI